MLKLDLSAEHQVYKAKDGTKVPGVTTILGTLNKEAIPPWYAEMEREGIWQSMGNGAWSADRLRAAHPRTKEGKYASYAMMKRDRAADLGTVTHGRIEAFLNNTELDPEGIPSDLYAQSQHGLDRFIEWWVGQELHVVETEKQMVSERLRVGGTGDCFAQRGGHLVYVDIKTSKASKWWPYDEAIAQVSCYAEMYHEVAGLEVAEVMLARVGKEQSDTLQTYTLTRDERAAGMDLFKAALSAYNAKKRLKELR
jgi:hypothetical protein